MNLASLNPKAADTRLRIPCTALSATIARLERDGQRVLAMERKRHRGQTDYLLTVHPVSVLRDFTPKTTL